MLLYTYTETEGKQMIRFLGWMFLIMIGLYTGIIPLLLSAVGFTFLAAGGALMSLAGGL